MGCSSAVIMYVWKEKIEHVTVEPGGDGREKYQDVSQGT